MEAEKIMRERFGKDSIIALATVEGSMPCVRNVDDREFSPRTDLRRFRW